MVFQVWVCLLQACGLKDDHVKKCSAEGYLLLIPDTELRCYFTK